MAYRDSNLSLRVDTNLSASYNTTPSPQELISASKSPQRERSASASRVLPSFCLPSSSVGQTEVPNRTTVPPGAARARHESRKLLAHVLSQLQRRPMPPSTMPGLTEQSPKMDRGISAVMRSFTGIAGAGGIAESKARKMQAPEDSDEELEDRSTFHTDVTLDLMIQLKDVLAISIAQGWDIFYEDADAIKKQGRHASFDKPRRRRRRSSAAGRSRSRSRSASPTGDVNIAAPELLSQCVSILASIILEDCRFQVTSPSPKRPPNALQSVTLDVAQVLIYAHQHEPRIVSNIGFSVLPAFRTFRSSMHARLLAFFEERVLGGMLENLLKVQGKEPVESISVDVTLEEPHLPRQPLVSILVDEVHDDIKTRWDQWRRWSDSTETPGLQSARAPEQPIAVYYLSSLVSPLLASILEYVDLTSADNPTTQRFHRFFHVLIQRKPDTYLDLLETIAYHTAKARYTGLSILTTYWPKAVGHVTLSKPIVGVTSETRDKSARRSSLTRRSAVDDHPYAHQFIPWRFSRITRPSFFDGLSPYDCRVCSQRIEGFGILCPFCMCAVHFDCYDPPDGSFFTEYPSDNDGALQKVAIYRFSHTLSSVRTGQPMFVCKEQHMFRTVNIFSMSLCFLCHRPLWGHITQGLKCNSCRQFVHASCLQNASGSDLPRCRDTTPNPASMTISHAALRTSFAEHFQDVVLSETELEQCTHEEISILHGILWLQLEILENGVALGSIVISDTNVELGHDDDEDRKMEEFELHQLVRSYETYLVQAKLPVSNTLQDYLSENDSAQQDCHAFFDWNILAFIASSLKVPTANHGPVATESAQLLSVSQLNAQDDESPEDAHPFEIVTLGYLRDQLGDLLNVHSDTAARHFLTFLHHVGLLERLDKEAVLFDGTPHPETLQCCLPLPFGFDISADVETLVACIEACLSDINLTVNELGFLALTRRFWPNGMLSDYTFRRLAKAILGWILSEDNNLAVILRSYVARGRELPGVRSGDLLPWPPQAQSRPTAAGAPGNGGDYVATRRALLLRYVAPWMLALHDQDLLNYATMVFDLLAEFAEEKAYWDSSFLGERSERESLKQKASVIDRILRYITKICQANVVFTVFDDLFQRWLERADTLEQFHEPLPSLLRLFSLEADGSQRHSIIIDARFSVGDLSALANVNPLQIMTNLATTTKSGFQRGLNWLNLFTSSGVDVPVPIFLQFATLTSKFKPSLADCSVLVDAALAASYLRPIGRLELQPIIGLLHEYLSPVILGSIQASESTQEVFAFIRKSLAVCLLLYGCERTQLIKLEIIKQEEVAHLPSRRKTGSRASTMSDPIIVDARLMAALKSYVDQKYEDLSCLVAKFFNAFINDTPWVESYEVDNFVLRNEAALCACTWEFYGIQLPALAMIRPALLVRVLVVDAQPFQRMLSGLLDKGSNWETRLETVLRLFRIILDVTSPAFVVEGRQWGPNVIDIFHYFFSAIWDDDREEIRTAVDTWASTLLPAHLDAITKCWNEALSKAPVSERVRLVRFLLQLRSHFPKWRVLMWETVIETLLDNEFMQKNGNDEDAAAAAHLSMYGLSSQEPSFVVDVDPELVILRVGLLTLSLKMVADGLGVDLFTLLRVKDQLARTLGYQDVAIVPSPSGQTFHIQFNNMGGTPAYAYPCITDLMFLLDSPHPFSLRVSAMGGPNIEDDMPSNLLVGSLFLDLVIGLFLDIEDLTALPPMTLKNFIKCLLIALQKHDFDSQPLRHLQPDLRKAVKRSLVDLVKDDCVSHEIRQLALSISQAFIRRCSHFAGKFISEAIDEATKMMIQLDFEHKADDLLVVQLKLFIEAILNMYAMSGVLAIFFKNPLNPQFFQVLRYVLDFHAKSSAAIANQPSLRETLLRDTLTRAAESEPENYQSVVDNICQYVEVVYHSHYTADTMQLIGLNLTNIARRTADWTTNTFDASPLLSICCTVIQHNKSQSRELLLYLETLLRAAMVRFYVSPACLTRVLQVTASLYRKVQPREQAFMSNVFAQVVFEILSDALHAKSRLSPSTLAAAIEALMENPSSLFMPPAKLSGLALDGVHFFHHGSMPDALPQDFSATQAVAKMVLQVAQQDSQIITSLSARHVSVRIWNVLLLTALSMDGSRCGFLLLQSLHAFSRSYYTSLIPGTPATPDYQSLNDIDISRAYIAMKLWLILARRVAQRDGGGDDFDTSGVMEQEGLEDRSARAIWNQLWPPFETALHALEQGGFTTSSLMLASTSVADLFLFLHQFRSVVSLESCSHTTLLNRLRSNGRVESKMSRTLRALNEPPPDVELEFFINQVTTEITAEERLLMEAAKLQEASRGGADKTRRMVS